MFQDFEDYGQEQRGGWNDDEMSQLNKALEAQEGITDIALLTSVGALQPQSLEGTVKSLIPKMSDLTLWKDVPKGNANSTLEEYTVESAYGQEVGWMDQMETPLEGDPEWQRKFAQVKYVRAMWKFSDVAGMVQTIAPVEIKSKRAALMRTLRNVNQTLYAGDGAMISQQIDGFEKIIRNNGSSDHVIDLRGLPPTQNTFRNAAELINANYGEADGANVYSSPGALTTLDQILENVGGSTAQRFIQSGDPRNMSIGWATKAIITTFGTMIPKKDFFLASLYESRSEPKRINASGNLVEGATSVRSPDIPSAVAAVVAPTVANSKWADTPAIRPSANTYKYKVVAGNRYGLSKASGEIDPGAPVVEAGSVTVTITPNPSSSFQATFYEVYSTAVPTPVSNPEYRFIGRIADSGAATTVFTDLNAQIPGTTKMFVMDFRSSGDREAYTLKQLAPVHSVEFARIGMYRWGVVNYYVSVLPYADRRYVMIENVPVGIETASDRLAI